MQGCINMQTWLLSVQWHTLGGQSAKAPPQSATSGFSECRLSTSFFRSLEYWTAAGRVLRQSGALTGDKAEAGPAPISTTILCKGLCQDGAVLKAVPAHFTSGISLVCYAECRRRPAPDLRDNLLSCCMHKQVDHLCKK